MTWDPAAALAEERRQILERLASLTGDYDDIVEANEAANADDEHDPEGATIAFERSQVGAFVTQARDHLAEVDAALARLSDGTYGACASCGRPVGEPRLEARPTARLCTGCASKH